MRETGLGLKAATITPEGRDDVGSPNRILREEVDGKVIIRTGRRLPGISPIAGVHHPISVVRMAVDDAYGAEQWREGDEGSPEEVAYRTERITRSTCRAVAEYAFRTASEMGARVYGGPKWTVSPVYEGMLKEEMDAAAERHPDTQYQPVLIDATYAGLISGATDGPLVIPALNRDGDCLSDLVLPMFGSIAAAESVLLAFDQDYETTVAMAEAPHGTAPALMGKDLANPLAMILACGAVLRYASVRNGTASEQRVPGHLRGRARDGCLRRENPGFGGTFRHHRVHRRGRRAGADQARNLVLARLQELILPAPRGPPPRRSVRRPLLGSRTYVPVFHYTLARLAEARRRRPRGRARRPARGRAATPTSAPAALGADAPRRLGLASPRALPLPRPGEHHCAVGTARPRRPVGQPMVGSDGRLRAAVAPDHAAWFTVGGDRWLLTRPKMMARNVPKPSTSEMTRRTSTCGLARKNFFTSCIVLVPSSTVK